MSYKEELDQKINKAHKEAQEQIQEWKIEEIRNKKFNSALEEYNQAIRSWADIAKKVIKQHVQLRGSKV